MGNKSVPKRRGKRAAEKSAGTAEAGNDRPDIPSVCPGPPIDYDHQAGKDIQLARETAAVCLGELKAIAKLMDSGHYYGVRFGDRDAAESLREAVIRLGDTFLRFDGVLTPSLKQDLNHARSQLGLRGVDDFPNEWLAVRFGIEREELRCNTHAVLWSLARDALTPPLELMGMHREGLRWENRSKFDRFLKDYPWERIAEDIACGMRSWDLASLEWVEQELLSEADRALRDRWKVYQPISEDSTENAKATPQKTEPKARTKTGEGIPLFLHIVDLALQKGILDLEPIRLKEETDEYVGPYSPQELRLAFGCSQGTLKNRLASQVIRNKMLNTKAYRVHRTDLANSPYPEKLKRKL